MVKIIKKTLKKILKKIKFFKKCSLDKCILLISLLGLVYLIYKNLIIKEGFKSNLHRRWHTLSQNLETKDLDDVITLLQDSKSESFDFLQIGGVDSVNEMWLKEYNDALALDNNNNNNNQNLRLLLGKTKKIELIYRNLITNMNKEKIIDSLDLPSNYFNGERGEPNNPSSSTNDQVVNSGNTRTFFDKMWNSSNNDNCIVGQPSLQNQCESIEQDYNDAIKSVKEKYAIKQLCPP